MAAKRYHDGEYAGMESRRKQEMEDGGMIREDRSAVANMPQEVMYKPYPKNNNYMYGDLNDTISGIDNQINNLDGAKRDKSFHPKKV